MNRHVHVALRLLLSVCQEMGVDSAGAGGR